MSDNEATDAKASAWTDEARYQFALRALAQFVEDGKKVNWQRLTMPGRTTKSLQNQWTKVNKQIQEINKEWAGGSPSPTKTPSKKATPRKRTPAKPKTAVEDDDDEEGVETPKETSAKKRGTEGASTPSKKPKTVKNEDEEDASPVKAESEDLNDNSV